MDDIAHHRDGRLRWPRWGARWKVQMPVQSMHGLPDDTRRQQVRLHDGNVSGAFTIHRGLVRAGHAPDIPRH